MATVEKMPMLEEGHRMLTEELNRLRQERPEIIDAIEEARAHGDLSENADYDAAKERQGFIEARIRDIESKLPKVLPLYERAAKPPRRYAPPAQTSR